jgi:UDP-glucose 4-epimerase
VLAQEVARAMGVKANIQYVPARNEVVHAYSSHDKVLRIFEERALTTLEDGLAQMAAWVKLHGARQSTEFEGVEIMKNFPKAWLLPKGDEQS